MGRGQILGNDMCPEERCPGYQMLGRYRGKKIRSRSTGSYRVRFYFRHNDSCIREHYADNYFRNDRKDSLELLNIQIKQQLDRIAQSQTKLFNRYSKFPLNKRDKQLLIFVMQWNCELIEESIRIQKKVIMDRHMGNLNPNINGEKLSREIYFETLEYLYARTNPLSKLIPYFYEKYDRPRRLERNKKRNIKLSKWEGRKTDDYTGIESVLHK